jgi:hypothetical protein
MRAKIPAREGIMRKFLIGLLLCAPSAAWATCVGITTPMRAYAFESITVSTVAIGGTSATYAPEPSTAPTMAIVSVESNPIRFRIDGTNPTSSVGHAAVDTNYIQLCGTKDVTSFRAIRSGASDATIRVTYYTR